MPRISNVLTQKLFRAREALTLLIFYAADFATRFTLIRIYAKLSQPQHGDDEVVLNLRIGTQVFHFHMRVSDIFILGEILHEKQYQIDQPLDRGATIVDLGGNVGASMIWFLGQYPDADYHVFEPSRDNLYFLERNAAPWSQVQLNKMAVGSEAGQMTLYHGPFGGMHSLIKPAEGQTAGSETVPVVTLADYMQSSGIDHINLLKIDIEGAEFEAVRGLGTRIADVDMIVGEVHDDLVDADSFYRYISKSGFTKISRQIFHEGAKDAVHGFQATRAS